MKKSLLAVVAALAMAGCSQNDLVDEIDNGGQISKKAEIGVNTVVKKGSRAAVMSNTDFTAFTLNAYIAEASAIGTSGLGNAYMDGVQYQGGVNSWTTTTGTYYWPTAKMQFFGYANGVTYTNPGATGYPSISYTLPDESANQKDIIVAYSKDVTKPSDNILHLTFQHILTRINFAVKPLDASYTYTIASITITGAKGGEAKYTFGGNDGQGGTWDITGTAPINGYNYSFDATAVTPTDGIYDYTESVAKNSLMLYPQPLAGVKIIVKYKTEKNGGTFFDDSKEVALSGSWTNGQSIRYVLSLPVGAEEMSVETTLDTSWDATNNSQEAVTPQPSN